MLIIIILFGALCSLGIAVTNVLRYHYVLQECNITSELYYAIETSADFCLDILRGISFCIFSYDIIINMRKYFNAPSSKFSCLMTFCCWLFSVVFILSTLAITICAATIGHSRDKTYILKGCNNSDEDTLQYRIIDSHTFLKASVFSSSLVASLYTTRILCSCGIKWRDKCDIVNDVPMWDGNENTLSAIVCDRFYHLLDNYKAVGREDTINIEHVTIKRWFLLSFFTYFAFVFFNIVHIIIGKNLGKDDSIQTPLVTLIYLISFLVPYCAAFWLNKQHQKYHEKMCESYLEIVKIKISDDIYLCTPGKSEKQKNEQDNGVTTRLLINQRSVWVAASEEDRRAVEIKYKEYYKEALKTTHRNEMVEKIEKFDFLPSFLIFSISIGNIGYVIPVMLSLFSILFSIAFKTS